MESERLEYIQLIVQAFGSSNNQQRNEAESLLIQKCLKSINSIQILVDLISTGPTGIDPLSMKDQVKMSASVLIATVIRRFSKGEIPYVTLVQQNHIECCIGGLKNSSVSFVNKGNIAVALSYILQQTITLQDGEQTRVIVQNTCRQLLEDKETIEAGVFIFQALVGVSECLAQSSQTPDFEWVRSFTRAGILITQAMLTTQDNLVQMQSVIKVEGFSCLKCVLKVFRARGTYVNAYHQLRELMLLDAMFSQSLINVLVFQVVATGQVIFCLTTDQLLDNLINEAKAKALGAYNYLLNHLTKEKPNSYVAQSPFYLRLVQLVPTVLYSLLSLSTREDYNLELIAQNNALRSLITQMLKLVTIGGKRSEFYSILSDVKSGMIIDVIFPFLSTTSSEQLLMAEDPQEFVNLALDTIDKQASDVPKTAASQLLQVYCDHIDGTTSFITQLSTVIIAHAVSVIQNQSEWSNPIMKEVENRYFFTKLSPVQRIDTALTSLTVMSYLLARRADLINLLEQMLVNNYNFYADPNQDPLVVARLCLFLGYYCDSVFKSDTQCVYLLDFIKLLLNQISAHNNKPWRLAVLYQAIDALKNIFEDNNLIPSVKVLLPVMFPVIVTNLKDSQYDPHFEMVMQHFRIYSKQIQNDASLIDIVYTVLTTRIMAEQQKLLNGDAHVQIWINKCWNILRAVPEIDGYIPLHLQLIEGHLLKLYNYLEDPTHIDFDEDIILVVSTMIEKSESITDAQKKLLYLLPKVQVKQQNRLGQMFDMLNNYIIYEREKDQFVYQQILGLAFKALYCQQESSNEVDEGEAVLIIQLCIQKWAQSIHIDLLREMFRAVITKSQTNISYNFLKSRLMGVYLSGLLFDFERCRLILMEFGYLETIIKQLTENSSLCTPGYDIKLYIYTLSQLIVKSPEEFPVQVIDQMVTLLEIQKQHEEKEAKKKKCDDSSDEEEEYIDNDDNSNESDSQLLDAMIHYETFKSDILKVDEFQAFRDMIHSLRQIQPQIVHQLKLMASSQQLNLLQQMLQVERVSSDKGDQQPRKIIQAHRRKVQQ